MTVDWNRKSLVDEYVQTPRDHTKNWYEREVNIPALLRMLPKSPARVMDFGCGPGDFSAVLARSYDVVAADESERMLGVARALYPDLEFLNWDGLLPFPQAASVGVFDAVVAKLSLEFVPDLSQLGAQFRALVRPGGTFVFSVQHPLLVIVSHPDEVIPYWDMKPFDVRVGSGGSTVTKIHRNLAQYLDPFLENGFSLVHVNEPEIPDNAAKAYQVDPKHFRVPKRLNVAFRLLDN